MGRGFICCWWTPSGGSFLSAMSVLLGLVGWWQPMINPPQVLLLTKWILNPNVGENQWRRAPTKLLRDLKVHVQSPKLCVSISLTFLNYGEHNCRSVSNTTCIFYYPWREDYQRNFGKEAMNRGWRIRTNLGDGDFKVSACRDCEYRKSMPWSRDEYSSADDPPCLASQ